jgi:hypothetical protein
MFSGNTITIAFAGLQIVPVGEESIERGAGWFSELLYLHWAQPYS